MRNKRNQQVSGDRVAAVEGERAETGVAGRAAELADIERLMEGFREEVQKLDEGLRMLSAYVSELRRRSHRGAGDTLH